MHSHGSALVRRSAEPRQTDPPRPRDQLVMYGDLAKSPVVGDPKARDSVRIGEFSTGTGLVVMILAVVPSSDKHSCSAPGDSGAPRNPPTSRGAPGRQFLVDPCAPGPRWPIQVR